MLTGLKGVKYGLQPGAKQKLKPALQKPLIVFGADDDSGDEAPTVGKDIARQAAKKQADKKVQDPTLSQCSPSRLFLNSTCCFPSTTHSPMFSHNYNHKVGLALSDL